MKFIFPSAEIMQETNPLIKIEKIGRICYKSNSEYTTETATTFIQSLIKRGHLSVLEHATFIFEADDSCKHYSGPFINYTHELVGDSPRTLYSTNLRAIIEQRYYDFQYALLQVYPDFSKVFDMTELEKRHGSKGLKVSEDITLTHDEMNEHLYTTFTFVTDRGVTHEMVRHRIASYTQESTRYCNYANDKFGSELQFIRPATFDDWSPMQKLTYMQSLETAEKNYMSLVNDGLPPQFARGVLPTDVRTLIVMTANHKEWEHFFDLRSRAKTGAPHPNMKVVANRAEELYFKYHSKYVVV